MGIFITVNPAAASESILLTPGISIPKTPLIGHVDGSSTRGDVIASATVALSDTLVAMAVSMVEV